MGGSGGGGGYYSPRSEQQTESSIQASRRATENADYEAAVSERLQDLLAAYNDRDTNAVNDRLDRVREALADYLESSIDLRFGGSVSKHTYVDGISDVDCLCFLDPSKFAADSPQQLLKEFEAVLKRVMGAGADVERGALSIKITFKDGPQLQILPALRTASGVRIPSAEENNWSQVVHPQRFAQALTSLNQRLNGKVVPMIKLVKPAIIKLYPKIKGYHVEVLAERIFQNYRGDLTSKAMAQHFFDRASEMIKTPIRDTTGQSVYVDDYLGPRNSADREALSTALRTIAQHMKDADASHSINGWLHSIEAE